MARRKTAVNPLAYAAVALAVVMCAPRTALAQPNVAGDWDLTVNMPQGLTVVMMTLEQDGDKITGKLANPPSPKPLSGTVSASGLKVSGALVFLDGDLPLDFNGTVEGNEWTGALKFGVIGEFPFTGKRAGSADADQSPADTAAPPAAPAASGTPAAAADSVTGKWDIVLSVIGAGDFPMSATFAQDGTHVTGTLTSPMGQVPGSGTMTGDSLTMEFTAATPQGSYTFKMTGQLVPNGLAGKASVAGLGEADWTASRAQP